MSRISVKSGMRGSMRMNCKSIVLTVGLKLLNYGVLNFYFMINTGILDLWTVEFATLPRNISLTAL